MDKIIFFVLLFLVARTYAQTGVNTNTPQNTLHVNGSLQVTNELNVGGNANNSGSSGDSGQVLISQGPGLSPVWQTLDIPNNNDTNSYKLKKVYQTTLKKASLSENDSSTLLGGITNIEVESANNFIFITTQSNTYLAPFTESAPSVSYRFDFLLNETVYDKTSWEVIQRQAFSDAAKNNPYQFTIINAKVGTHSLNVRGVRQKSSGTSRTLYFNAIDRSLNEKKGSLVIFVYEK
ncbi:hypothetical protein [Myroides odoratimimus]|uniref:hypothetical protein n=1 Tax=Myroides odoratimimus TaxID=76832 RepID=UPI002577943D|nr:hypothetical protein [Myroides odoratimimus]MDM1513507.1 hypothetical protein [Myroides odoratimimus]